jgi:preprotein translocase subunit SecD
MNRGFAWKSVLIVSVVVFFLYGIFGIPRHLTGQAVASSILRRIHLGLDLKGGTHLILQVQVNDAVRADALQSIGELKHALQRRNIPFTNIAEPDPTNNPDHIVITGVPLDHSSDLRDIVQKELPDYQLTSQPQNTWMLSMAPAALSNFKNQTVTESIETIRNRIDQLGVTEPVIEKYGIGQYEILVELPGVSDPARVKSIMKSTAMLEIRQALGGPYESEQQAYAAHNGVLPPDTELLPGRSSEEPGSGQGPAQIYYLVSSTPAITGRDLRTGGARVGTDENERPDVDFALTNTGAKKFEAFTGSHIGDQLAVVLDKKVMEVATIQQQISDQGRITGGFTTQSAKDLALVLNSGALPASIHYLEESTVGPSLGADSIRDGVRAAIIGMLAVLIFMPIYYRGAGVNADLALILNLVILLGFLGFSGATLTLPGIAGAILTVGMGVDSNVLIFERIREEMRNGKPPGSAVESGFSHAWVTIVDTHITTIVSAAILFIFGTGPVKGFAVTLTFGLLANLFTAVFVSRTIFDFILSHKQRGAALSI